jgi:hypothetical protein
MFAMFILVLFYGCDRVTASLWIRYLEYSWVKATMDIYMLIDYSVAKKHQQSTPLIVILTAGHICFVFISPPGELTSNICFIIVLGR